MSGLEDFVSSDIFNEIIPIVINEIEIMVKINKFLELYKIKFKNAI